MDGSASARLPFSYKLCQSVGGGLMRPQYQVDFRRNAWPARFTIAGGHDDRRCLRHDAVPRTFTRKERR